MNAPKLRFKEFTDNWENKKLDNFLTESKIKGNTGEKAKKLTVKLWGKGVVPKQEIYNGSNNTQYYIRKSGQLIYGKLDFLNCAFGIIPSHLDKYESTIDAPAFDINDMNTSFLINKITQKKFYKKNGDIADGSRRAKRINSNIFLDMSIFVPSLEEQKKIGDFFTLIDEKIDLQTKKIESLEKYKKGLMQKIFKRELRFKDELGNDYPEWETKKLGDICTFFSGGTPSTKNSSYYNGSIPFIRSGEISSYTTELLLTEEGLNNSSAKLVEKGDLLYALYGATSGEVSISKINGAINQAILCIKSNKINIYFLENILSYNKDNIITKLIQGGQGNLSANLIKSLSYEIPSLEEQQKISNFLTSIDKKIELEKEKLNNLKLQKSGFLQKMFI
ncbi:MAG: restriction endonuclease subunit S [Peptostreptococcaceae bacterium]